MCSYNFCVPTTTTATLDPPPSLTHAKIYGQTKSREHHTIKHVFVIDGCIVIQGCALYRYTKMHTQGLVASPTCTCPVRMLPKIYNIESVLYI